MKHLAFLALALLLPAMAVANGTYADSDNRDNQKVLVEDQRTELATHLADHLSRKERHKHMSEAFSHGAISEAAMAALEHELEGDPFQTALLEGKIRNTLGKIAAYDAFINGKKREWLTADVDSNRGGVAMFEAELKKAELEVVYLGKRLARLKDVYESGALPWGTYHQAQLELTKAEIRRDGVRRKLDEQRRQLADAEEELRKYKPR